MDARARLESLGADRKRLAELCARWKIVELAVFGSALRDDFSPQSDVDLLVTFHRDAEWSLLDMVRLERECAALLGRPVDVLTRDEVEDSANWIRRKAILETAVPVYAS